MPLSKRDPSEGLWDVQAQSLNRPQAHWRPLPALFLRRCGGAATCTAWELTAPEHVPVEDPAEQEKARRAPSRGGAAEWLPKHPGGKENNPKELTQGLGPMRFFQSAARPSLCPLLTSGVVSPGGDPPPPRGRNVLWPALRLRKGHLNLSGGEGKTAGGNTRFREACSLAGRGGRLLALPLSPDSSAPGFHNRLWVYLSPALSKKKTLSWA